MQTDARSTVQKKYRKGAGKEEGKCYWHTF